MSFIEWKDQFEEIFEDYPHRWTLSQVHRNNERLFTELQSQQCLTKTRFARFHCPKCSKGWASAKAKLEFYYPQANQRLGRVNLRLYGQQCRTCSQRKLYFVDPEFEIDDIKLMLEQLHERIGWQCYHKARPPKPVGLKPKENKMQGPHESKLCEACQLGRCDQMP